ncbi:NAD-dependent protein deacetylase [Paenibacillus solanacearum]|uniref:protein acetyllysine N-acetyltransferase n=1 Tax=Paenibacillus solanacearum TaxID=2048548 RepID=A0A916K579_9BACL|nr:Sir2 family NAD-dependent protein deacetylase [Paenibacillus solanacearum]CAG7644601.1 NAD-dependent protein deacetylase [Paenibacillus solanacearum]
MELKTNGRFEVLHTLVFWKKTLHRHDYLGFVLKDHKTGETAGYTFDEAWERIRSEGGTNAVAEQSADGSSKRLEPRQDLPIPPLPRFNDASWHLSVFTADLQHPYPFSDQLKKAVDRAVDADIRWNLEVRKRRWKQQERYLYDHMHSAPEKEKRKTAKDWIRNAAHIVVLTGAGISTESGVPDFRSGAGAISANPSYLVTMSAPYRDANPEQFWKSFTQLLTDAMEEIIPNHSRAVLSRAIGFIQPNAGHTFFSRLENMGKQISIITQNVDDLHEKAGSLAVIHPHGALLRSRCSVCGAEANTLDIMNQPDAPGLHFREGKRCEGILLPDVVLFGDPVKHWEHVGELAESADLLIVAGTSLQVSPMNELPCLAKHARKIIINHEPTPHDDLFDLVLSGPIGGILKEIEAAMDLESRRKPAPLTCDVCRTNAAEGVYSSRIAPVSAAYCQPCMNRGAEPYGILVTKLALLPDAGRSPRLTAVIESSLEIAGKTGEQLMNDVTLRRQQMEKERDRSH